MSSPSLSFGSVNERNFETRNEVIIDWIDTKIREVCRCIGIFMKYLLISRKGYKTFPRPVLNLPIVTYVIEDILNCARVSKENIREVYPEDFSIKVRRIIREEFGKEIQIGSDIIEYLWKYISFGVTNLTEGLNYEEELKRYKDIRKRRYINMNKKEIDELKRKIQESDESGIRNMVVKTVSSYRRLKAYIRQEIDSVDSHLENFDTIPFYKSENMGVVLTDEDRAVLIEFGVQQKRFKKLKSIKSSLDDKIKSLNENGPSSYPVYKSDCKELLIVQKEVLDHMNKDLKKSKIGQFLENRKKNKVYERKTERTLLDKMYDKSRARADKWKRASIARILIEDADYDVKVRPPMKQDYEFKEVWIRGDEDMGKDELKLTTEMIDKEYIDFNTKKGMREFLETARDQLNQQLNEIENDKEIESYVMKIMINKIQSKIQTYQTFVSMRTCDNNFDDDTDNCIFQSLIYLSITVSDWLEVSQLGKDELETTLRILVPESLQKFIDNSDSESDDKFKSLFVKGMQTYGLSVDTESLGLVVSTIKKIKALPIDDKRFISFQNRVRYFANSLLPKK